MQPRHPARLSLPFREPALSLRDILDAIEMIAQFVRAMDFGGMWKRFGTLWFDDLPPLKSGVLSALTKHSANPGYEP